MSNTERPTIGRPSDVRTALLDAAEVEVRENGAGELSMRAVARRAHVSHQAPAHFFVNRRGMLTAVATRGVDRLTTALEATVGRSSAEPPPVRLALLGMAYVDFAVTNRGLFTLASSPDQIDTRDPHLDTARHRAWTVLAECVAQAQRFGWRVEEDTDTVALACWSMVHGSAGMWRDGWLDAQYGDRARNAIWTMLTTVL